MIGEKKCYSIKSPFIRLLCLKGATARERLQRLVMATFGTHVDLRRHNDGRSSCRDGSRALHTPNPQFYSSGLPVTFLLHMCSSGSCNLVLILLHSLVQLFCSFPVWLRHTECNIESGRAKLCKCSEQAANALFL